MHVVDSTGNNWIASSRITKVTITCHIDSSVASCSRSQMSPNSSIRYTNFFPIAFFYIPYYNWLRKDIKEFEMTTDATLTSKGQTTIPKEIRDSLHMKAGDRMTFTLMPDATVVMRVKSKSVTELAGMLHKKGRKAVPLELLSR